MHPSEQMILTVVKHLGPLVHDVVFLGGAVAKLLITDPVAPDIRMTNDVDIVVEVASGPEYNRLETRLRKLGFQSPPIGKPHPICRYYVDGVLVDIMPTNSQILGFANRWYKEAMQAAVPYRLNENCEIQIVAAPYFLATKIEAFHHRGENDFYGSHDLEDIIAVLDGREEIIEEIQTSPVNLQTYLAEEFKQFWNNSSFREALLGHLPGDQASQARLPLLEGKIQEIMGSC